jgi:ubiquinone/menaquinone biosynthesis C-methylase UbiE
MMARRILRISLMVVGALTLAAGVAGLRLWQLKRATGTGLAGYFDLIYRHPAGAFTYEPNALLMETVSKLPPGRALDVAMGEGRNAVWLAMQGWDVTGFDISSEALSQARARAEKAGVRMRVVRATSQDFDYGVERWDLLVLSYAFAPIENPGYVERLRRSLKPAGLLVFEHYQRPAATPFPLEGAPRPGEARRIFSRFRMVRYEEQVARGDWAFRRIEPLVRVVAAKE